MLKEIILFLFHKRALKCYITIKSSHCLGRRIGNSNTQDFANKVENYEGVWKVYDNQGDMATLNSM